MRKPLIAIIGVSGSGKSTIANKLERKYGYKSVKSYTTRPIRDDPEDISTHTFITLDEIDQYKDDIVADNWYNDNYYFCTKTQLDNSDIYIVDKSGLIKLYKNYFNKDIISIYLEVSPEIVAQRMEQRGDSNEQIMTRLQYDSEAFKGVKEMCDFVCTNETQNQMNDVIEFIDMLFKYYNVKGE